MYVTIKESHTTIVRFVLTAFFVPDEYYFEELLKLKFKESVVRDGDKPVLP